MVHKLLQSFELSSSGDVIAPAVQLSDFVVFHMIAFSFVPVLYGQWVRSYEIRLYSGLKDLTVF